MVLTWDCLRVNEVWSTYLSHPLCMILVLYSMIGLDNSWWVNTTKSPLQTIINKIGYGCDGSVVHTLLTFEQYEVLIGLNKTHVATDITYILPAAHRHTLCPHLNTVHAFYSVIFIVLFVNIILDKCNKCKLWLWWKVTRISYVLSYSYWVADIIVVS